MALESDCRQSVNHGCRSKNKAKRCRQLWNGLQYCFVEGVRLTKAMVDHPSLMI